MKILGKLIVMMLVLTVGFAGALAALLGTSTTTKDLENLRFQSLTAVKDAYALSDTVKAVLAMDKNLTDLYGSLVTAFSALSTDIKGLPSNPGVVRLPAALKADVSAAAQNWDLVQAAFNKTDEGFAYVMSTTEIPATEKRGLLTIRRVLESRGADSSMLLSKILTAQTSVENLDAFLRQFVVESLTTMNQKIDQQVTRTQARGALISILISAVLLGCAGLLSFLFARSVAKRLQSIEDSMRSVASRDLTHRAKTGSRDEIGTLARHINSVLETLGGFLTEVGAAATHVDALKDTLSSSTNESTAALNQTTVTIQNIKDRCLTLERAITATGEALGGIGREVQALAHETESQTASITTTTTAIEEMAASITSVSRLSEERKDRISGLLAMVADSGKKAAQTNDMIRQVSREIDSIHEAISVINGVAAQTNLLSMNAAIESAHAGDAGRGFAVVADEIRKLAESTTAHAKRIGSSLKSITARIRQALESADKSYKSFDEINSFISELANALDEISGSMTELNKAAADMLRASASISEAASRVNSSSHEIDKRTTDIQSAMKDSTRISNEISAGMMELEKGSHEILVSMVEVTKVVDTTRERMVDLRKAVAGFKS